LESSRESPATLEAQAYQLLLICRLNCPTLAEMAQYERALLELLPDGETLPSPPLSPPAAEPPAASSPDEALYRRVLDVWSHPTVRRVVRDGAFEFLARYLASGRASSAFVAATCDEGTAVLEGRRREPGENDR
jgi:hypothetical protein